MEKRKFAGTRQAERASPCPWQPRVGQVKKSDTDGEERVSTKRLTVLDEGGSEPLASLRITRACARVSGIFDSRYRFAHTIYTR